MRIATVVVDRRDGPAGCVAGREPSPPNFDWTPWRYLPVLDGGRHKPLDSLAWETARMIGNRAGLADPETGQKLDATGLYLAMLLDWQGWDHPAAGHMTVDTQSHGAYFIAHQPDKWDRAGLILVENLELRRALGIAEDQKYIAPLESLPRQDPRSALGRGDSVRPLGREAGPHQAARLHLIRKEGSGSGRSPLGLPGAPHGSTVGSDPLAGQRARRMGVALFAGAAEQGFGGPTRALKDEFARLRGVPQRFHGGLPGGSAAFIAAARQSGPQLGPYPSRRLIGLEVAYNHWTPFRFAWIFVLLSAILVLLSMGTQWRPFYAGRSRPTASAWWRC